MTVQLLPVTQELQRFQPLKLSFYYIVHCVPKIHEKKIILLAESFGSYEINETNNYI